MACNSCHVDKCVPNPNSNFSQSNQIFGSLRSSYADLATHYSRNYYNAETRNNEFRTKTERDLLLFLVNIRSVVMNEDYLIDIIGTMRFPPEIIVITETKLHVNRVFYSNPLGYGCLRADSLTCAVGVDFLTKSTLNYEIRHDPGMSVAACVNLWIEINQLGKKHAYHHWCSLQTSST